MNQTVNLSEDLQSSPYITVIVTADYINVNTRMKSVTNKTILRGRGLIAAIDPHVAEL